MMCVNGMGTYQGGTGGRRRTELQGIPAVVHRSPRRAIRNDTREWGGNLPDRLGETGDRKGPN